MNEKKNNNIRSQSIWLMAIFFMVAQQFTVLRLQWGLRVVAVVKSLFVYKNGGAAAAAAAGGIERVTLILSIEKKFFFPFFPLFCLFELRNSIWKGLLNRTITRAQQQQQQQSQSFKAVLL